IDLSRFFTLAGTCQFFRAYVRDYFRTRIETWLVGLLGSVTVYRMLLLELAVIGGCVYGLVPALVLARSVTPRDIRSETLRIVIPRGAMARIMVLFPGESELDIDIEAVKYRLIEDYEPKQQNQAIARTVILTGKVGVHFDFFFIFSS